MASSFAVKMGEYFLVGLGIGLVEHALKPQEKREKQDSSWVSEFLRGVAYGIPNGQDFAKQARKDLGNEGPPCKKNVLSPEELERFEIRNYAEMLAREIPTEGRVPEDWAHDVVLHAAALHDAIAAFIKAHRVASATTSASPVAS